ncbi:hypothetical protein D3C80_1990490 [compost metagenome]
MFRYNDQDIDFRLGRKLRHRRAADMVNGDEFVVKAFCDAGLLGGEKGGPSAVVGANPAGERHGASLVR